MRRIATVTFAVLLIGVVVYSAVLLNWQWFMKNIDIVEFASGWIATLTVIVYHRWSWLYLWVQKVRFFLWDSPCRWDVTATYEVTMVSSDINALEVRLTKKHRKDFEVISGGTNRRLYRVGTVTVEVSLHDYSTWEIEQEGVRLHVGMYDCEVNFKRSLALLTDLIAPFFQEVEDFTVPISRRYSLRARFGESNPYYGLFLQRLKANDISRFDVLMVVDNEHVAINKEAVEINAESIVRLVTKASDYLALSPKGVH